jgi:hypothetical protein
MFLGACIPLSASSGGKEGETEGWRTTGPEDPKCRRKAHG